MIQTERSGRFFASGLICSAFSSSGFMGLQCGSSDFGSHQGHAPINYSQAREARKKWKILFWRSEWREDDFGERVKDTPALNPLKESESFEVASQLSHLFGRE